MRFEPGALVMIGVGGKVFEASIPNEQGQPELEEGESMTCIGQADTPGSAKYERRGGEVVAVEAPPAWIFLTKRRRLVRIDGPGHGPNTFHDPLLVRLRRIA